MFYSREVSFVLMTPFLTKACKASCTAPGLTPFSSHSSPSSHLCYVSPLLSSHLLSPAILSLHLIFLCTTCPPNLLHLLVLCSTCFAGETNLLLSISCKYLPPSRRSSTPVVETPFWMLLFWDTEGKSKLGPQSRSSNRQPLLMLRCRFRPPTRRRKSTHRDR